MICVCHIILAASTSYYLKTYINRSVFVVDKDFVLFELGPEHFIMILTDFSLRRVIFYINNCPARCKQSSLFIILRVHSTCFGCQPYPSSGVCKTVTTASDTGQLLCSCLPPTWPSLATLEVGSCTENMTSTGGCSYSFVYS